MRELTAAEIQAVSGGSWSIDAESATFTGAVMGGVRQVLRGARIGAVLGPQGALGGAILGGLAFGVGRAYSDFRSS